MAEISNTGCELRSRTCLSGAKAQKKKKVKNPILIPLIFTYYERLFKIDSVALVVDDVTSYARLFNFNRYSSSRPELSQSTFKVENARPWRSENQRVNALSEV